MSINDYIKSKVSNKVSGPLSADETIEKYSNLSESELMQELFKNAEASRNRGELNDDMLNDFYNQMQGLLTPEQRERMRELIIELKK